MVIVPVYVPSAKPFGSAAIVKKVPAPEPVTVPDVGVTLSQPPVDDAVAVKL